MKKTILTLMLLIALFKSGISQILFDKVKLDKYFDALEQNDKFMGSVALSKNGKIIYTRSTGFADIESKLKATENTRYRIGSITKTFTATLVMKAVELNKLSLNETLDKYFPAIKNAPKISIANMLSHRSGIHNFTDDAAYEQYHTTAKTEQEIVNLIVDGGIEFEPDTRMKYSNSNYVLLITKFSFCPTGKK